MWTDRRNLKRLKEIQERIRVLEEATSMENCPLPSWKITDGYLKDFYGRMYYGLTPSLKRIYTESFGANDANFADHLQVLGEYFLKLSDNMRDYQKNRKELTKLRKEEKQLKEKLGIN